MIDFARSRVADHSGLEAIDTLAERYENAGKRLHLVHLSDESRRLLKKAGNLVVVNVIEDPKYFVADTVWPNLPLNNFVISDLVSHLKFGFLPLPR